MPALSTSKKQHKSFISYITVIFIAYIVLFLFFQTATAQTNNTQASLAKNWLNQRIASLKTTEAYFIASQKNIQNYTITNPNRRHCLILCKNPFNQRWSIASLTEKKATFFHHNQLEQFTAPNPLRFLDSMTRKAGEMPTPKFHIQLQGKNKAAFFVDPENNPVLKLLTKLTEQHKKHPISYLKIVKLKPDIWLVASFWQYPNLHQSKLLSGQLLTYKKQSDQQWKLQKKLTIRCIHKKTLQQGLSNKENFKYPKTLAIANPPTEILSLGKENNYTYKKNNKVYFSFQNGIEKPINQNAVKKKIQQLEKQQENAALNSTAQHAPYEDFNKIKKLLKTEKNFATLLHLSALSDSELDPSLKHKLGIIRSPQFYLLH